LAKITSLQKAVSDLVGWRLPPTEDIHDIALDDEALSIAIGGALIPDHAVFLEKQVPVSTSAEEVVATLAEYRTAFGDNPDWMIVRGAGVILSSRLGSTGEAQLQGLSAIALRIPLGSEVRYIDENAAADLKNWDAEIYRKKLDKERS
jgi:rhamnose utilization protein RhaD (predicted bifunctional aldolase and dehydrogenase)